MNTAETGSETGRRKPATGCKTYMLKVLLLQVLLTAAFVGHGHAQEALAEKDSVSTWKKLQEAPSLQADEKKIQITQSFQLWNIYTVKSAGSQGQESRDDLYIRRGRLGVKGKLASDLAFNITFSYDGIGRANNTAGRGNPNPDDNHDFFLFEALSMWSYKPLLNITAGYFRPQVGREQMTAPFKTTSFEYSLANFQPRAHLVGRGTGRELGVNVGGLYKASGWSLNYNAGLFDISSAKLVGESSNSFPMLAGRLALSLGDPEMEKYGLGIKQSFYGSRKGITIGLNGSYLGTTELFESNSFYGGDILANYGPVDFVFECDWLSRRSILEQENSDLGKPEIVPTSDMIYTYKLAYNFPLKNGKILQAAAMYTSQLANDYGDTRGLNALTGASDQEVYEVGINYLLNKDNLKLNMHYVWGERTDQMPDHQYAYLGTGFQYLF